MYVTVKPSKSQLLTKYFNKHNYFIFHTLLPCLSCWTVSAKDKTHTHTSPTSTIQPSNTLKILPLRVRFRLRHHHRTRSRYWEGCRIQGRVIDFRAPWHILRRNETLPRFGLFGELVWLGFNCWCYTVLYNVIHIHSPETGSLSACPWNMVVGRRSWCHI